MKPSQLKAHLMEGDGESKFFSRENMRFAGDTMSNFGVRSAKIDNVECWELWRKKPVKCGIQTSFYFRKDNFRLIRATFMGKEAK